MKKNFVLILTIFAISNLFSVSPFVNFGIKSYYDSNIIKLSQNGRDDFLDNYNAEKYNIDSLDDWVTQFNLTLGLKTKFPKKHTQVFKFNFVSTNYYENSVKGGINLSLSYKQFISKKFNYLLSYTYYPKIYLRKYKSEFDDTDKYHDFTYAKNSYHANLVFMPVKALALKAGVIYSQLYYNEYFTEYDTNNLERFLRITVKRGKILEFSSKIGYKTSEQTNQNQALAIKDPTAEANLFDFQLKMAFKKFRNRIKFAYEEKFFSSDNQDDKYHYKRNDYKQIINETLSYKINNRYSLSFMLESEKRDTRSPFSSVEDDKSYKLYRLGVNFKINLVR